MKLLVLCPGKVASSVTDIGCFTDVLNYYLPKSLSQIADTTVVQIPNSDDDKLKKIFSKLNVDDYDAILTLGLRFYSKTSKETTNLLRSRFKGLFCQIYDGSRLDNDPVDITFTFKNDDERLSNDKARYSRHKQFNEYMGWAADPQLNFPQQDPNDLRILVDHTNYGNNEVDYTVEVLRQIKQFIDSGVWKSKFKSVSVRRFESGKVVDVDFNNIAKIERYDRTPIPFSEITKEHCAAHIFCVTHPESVGLVVLETAMAGALAVVPKGFIPKDRLKTVRHVQWEDRINWKKVLNKIDVDESRKQALDNTWDMVATRIVLALKDRFGSEKTNDVVNVVCLKWGSKYGPEYVNRLYAGVKRNTTVNFKFWCFTDDATGIISEVNTVPLPYANQLDSWWNKLNLFSNDLPFDKDSTIFYIDLDTLIVNNIDNIISTDTQNLVVLRDFYHGVVKSATLVGSGLMMWKHGLYNHIWEKFMVDPEKHVADAKTYGDQWWIEKQVSDPIFWQDLYPEQVVSFKVHCRKGLPNNARVICYHGRPSIPESINDTNVVGKLTIAPQPWVLKHWRDSLEPCRIYYAEIPAREIFGMVGRSGGGYNTVWSDWSPEGRQARELIMKEYEEELNKICGHYEKLEKSILQEGIRNPVVITCGLPKRRTIKNLPPEMLEQPESNLLLLEGTTGGSRLHVAQKHNLTIPCIVTDWTGRFKGSTEIITEDQARSYYKDSPTTIILDNQNGYYEEFENDRVSHHLGEEWSEDKVMPLRAPMWISIMNKHGYQIDRLMPRVQEVLAAAGVVQPANKENNN